MAEFWIDLEQDNRAPRIPGWWRMRQGEHELNGLCWDEMLGCCARILINGLELRSGGFQDDYNPPAVWSLRVEPILDGVYWTIHKGGRFIDHMTPDEALGFIAAYTLTGREMFMGFMTYEQWARRPYRAQQEIAGLLTA